MTARLKKQFCTALKARLAGERVPLPAAGTLLLQAFNALSRQRSYGPNGPNPISWEALATWSSMMRQPLDPHHADIIMALDQAWLEHSYRREAQAPEGVKVLPPVSEHPISAALLEPNGNHLSGGEH